MLEATKFVQMNQNIEGELRKKPEMVRRSKLVKWVRRQNEMFEVMYGRSNPEYMEGMAYVLNKLCDDFGIDGLDLQD